MNGIVEIEHNIRSNRASLTPGCENAMRETLVDPLKILPPSFHIKLGIMLHFVKAQLKDSPYFMYLWDKFKYSSDAKIKEGIFVEPEIR